MTDADKAIRGRTHNGERVISVLRRQFGIQLAIADLTNAREAGRIRAVRLHKSWRYEYEEIERFARSLR